MTSQLAEARGDRVGDEQRLAAHVGVATRVVNLRGEAVLSQPRPDGDRETAELHVVAGHLLAGHGLRGSVRLVVPHRQAEHDGVGKRQVAVGVDVVGEHRRKADLDETRIEVSGGIALDEGGDLVLHVAGRPGRR